MNVVYYFSGSGNTKEVATHIAQELDFSLEEIFKNTPDHTETAVVVFPVYCQNIPKPVKCIKFAKTFFLAFGIFTQSIALDCLILVISGFKLALSKPSFTARYE